MALSIHRPNEGYYTRVVSAAGAGLVILTAAAWVWSELAQIGDDETRSIAQTVSAVVIVLGLGAISFWIMNKPNVVDFFVATESEMRKVNWPTKRELVGSTWVVICGTFMLVATLFVFDIFFLWFFGKIGILQVGL